MMRTQPQQTTPTGVTSSTSHVISCTLSLEVYIGSTEWCPANEPKRPCTKPKQLSIANDKPQSTLRSECVFYA